jgi:hypothetical protein
LSTRLWRHFLGDRDCHIYGHKNLNKTLGDVFFVSVSMK